jgi:hypothetical protein
MNALLRYIVLKGTREHFIATFLLAPAMFMVLPLITTAVFNIIRGRGSWPLTLAGSLSPDATAQILVRIALIFAATIAGTAAFWVFRSEITARSMSFFFLAQRPAILTLMTMLFGFGAGLLSYVISATALLLLTGAPLSTAAMPAVSALTMMLVAAATGTLLVAISSELAMLIPVYVITILAVGFLGERAATPVLATTISGAVAFMIASPFVWRWKCAA